MIALLMEPSFIKHYAFVAEGCAANSMRHERGYFPAAKIIQMAVYFPFWIGSSAVVGLLIKTMELSM